MRTFIFACVHNAGRSQMSAAFFNQLADADKAHAISAGTHPSAHVHPVVIDVMREFGIDLSAAQPQRLTPELAQGAEMLITMGCGEECPYIPGLQRTDWPLLDPKGQNLDAVRSIREEIRQRVCTLLTEKQLLLYRTLTMQSSFGHRRPHAHCHRPPSPVDLNCRGRHPCHGSVARHNGEVAEPG